MKQVKETHLLAHLSTDKPLYRPGETIYGRAVLLDALTHAPFEAPVVLQFELRSPVGTALYRCQVQTEKSVAAFSWCLPADSAGGEYSFYATSQATPPATLPLSVRAYRVPRLLGELRFLRQSYGPGEEVDAVLSVRRAEGGTPEGALVTAISRVDHQEIWRRELSLDQEGSCAARFTLPTRLSYGEGTLSVIIRDGGVEESLVKSIPLVLSGVSLSFYPEGGALVAGLSNRLYLEAKTSKGSPASIAGKIVSPEGETLAHFETEHEGRARVSFTPKRAGEGYLILLDRPAGLSQTFSLPSVASEGALLQTLDDTGHEGEPIRLEITTTQARELWLVLSAKEKELHRQLLHVPLGGARLSIPLEEGASGVLRLTLFDTHERPFSERLFFQRPKESLHIEVTASPPAAGPRASVSLKIKTTDARTRAPRPASLLLSVVDDAVLSMKETRAQPPRLTAQALLEGDVKELWDAETYLAPDQAKKLDLLLGTQGWRRFAFYEPVDFVRRHGEAAERVLARARYQKHAGRFGAARQPIVGVQFGALSSSVALVQGKDARILCDQMKRSFFPSVVTYPKQREALACEEQPGRSVKEIKNVLGKKEEALSQRERSALSFPVVSKEGRARIDIDGRLLAPEEIAAQLLQKLKEVARTSSKEEITSAVIAVPPLFVDAQRQAVKDAGKIAGLEVKRIINEPVAAALAYGLQSAPQETLVAVYDLGASFTATLLLAADSIFEIVAVRSAPHLGAAALDQVLVEHLKTEYQKKTGIDPSSDPEAMSMLGAAAQRARLQLDTAKEVKVRLPKRQTLTLRRSTFERLIAPVIEQTFPLFQEVLAEAARGGSCRGFVQDGVLSPKRVQEVILVGGCTLIPLVQRKVKGFFERKPLQRIDPRAVVALGAALQGSILGGEVRDMLLLDFVMPPPEERETASRPPVRTHPKEQRRKKQTARVLDPSLTIAVREYAHRALPKNVERNDFAETLYWRASLRTNKNGEATARFALSDSITSFRARVDAFSLSGALGQADALIESKKELYLEPRLPLEVSEGDLCWVPVSIVNNTAQALSADVVLTSEGALSTPTPAQRLRLAPGARVKELWPLEVGPGKGAFPITLAANAKTFHDAVRRSLRVAPAGFPRSQHHAGQLKKEARHRFSLSGVVPGSLSTEAIVYPSPLSSLVQAFEALVREPYGCFEQTSSSNYPNVLVMQYLTRFGGSPSLLQRTSELLDKGYKRLISFECPEGGFDWFGQGPAHEALTAYGLLQFYEMSKVYPVDPQLLARTRAWLLGRRDGEGGFALNKKYLHYFGASSQDCMEAYITWALLRLGERGLTQELAKVKERALASEDAYQMALAANALLEAKDPEADRFLRRLASWQEEDGSLRRARTSITYSSGEGLWCETTALALLAWLQAEGSSSQIERAVVAPSRLPNQTRPKQAESPSATHGIQAPKPTTRSGGTRSLARRSSTTNGSLGLMQTSRSSGTLARGSLSSATIERAMRWLLGRSREGRFGSTQATILSLQAILAHSELYPAEEREDKVSITIDGALLGELPFRVGQREALLLPSFAERLTAGEHELCLRTRGESALPYSIALRYHTRQPDSAPNCQVGIQTKLFCAEVAEGEALEGEVLLENRTPGALPMVVAILGLPGGVEARSEQLQELIGGGACDFIETKGREVLFYLRSMEPKERRRIPLSLIAAVPGRYIGPASRAYLYYTDEEKDWAAPLRIEVRRATAYPIKQEVPGALVVS